MNTGLKAQLGSRALSAGSMIVVAVTAGHFINDAYAAMLSPLGPALQSKYGVSIAAVTLLGSVFSLTSSVLQPLLGIFWESAWAAAPAPFWPHAHGPGAHFRGLRALVWGAGALGGASGLW